MASKWSYGAGRRFEGIEVQVKGGPSKGLRGTVVGDHDSSARVERLERERKYMRAAAGDFEGVLLTIGEERSNRKVENIPIEHVVHE